MHGLAEVSAEALGGSAPRKCLTSFPRKCFMASGLAISLAIFDMRVGILAQGSLNRVF